MYRNFICYRGGSSAGMQIAEQLFLAAKAKKEIVGETYYSLAKDDFREMRNFLTDPGKYLGNVENFIMLLTKDFFSGFIEDGRPNPDSVTRIEIDEVLKNDKVKFIPVIFPDFSWEARPFGMSNKEVISSIWGEEAMTRIVGSPPIPFVMLYKEQVIHLVIEELAAINTKKKVVIFDFDGTLTKPSLAANTWETLWMLLGYPVEECEKYHRQFSRHEINHDEWCEITEKKFMEAGCTRAHLKQAAETSELVDDVKKVILELKSNGITLYILSGSIKQYIEYVLGKDLAKCFKEIKANRFTFDEQGRLEAIVGTPYDFEGKARFVKKIMQEGNIQACDIIYVGNSFNDEFVYTTGVETLCINPRDTDYYNNKVWHYYIRNLRSLTEILPYIYGEPEER